MPPSALRAPFEIDVLVPAPNTERNPIVEFVLAGIHPICVHSSYKHTVSGFRFSSGRQAGQLTMRRRYRAW